MDLLRVHRQKRKIDVVGIEDGTARAMFESISGFEIFPVKAGSFAVAAFADGFIGWKYAVHNKSPWL
jgi:hypothetical protein